MSKKKDIKNMVECVTSVVIRLDALSLRLNTFEKRLDKMYTNQEANHKYSIDCGLTLSQWQQVLGGEYLCGFSNESYGDAYNNSQNDPSLLIDVDDVSFISYGKIPYKYCCVREVYGERQPWFGEGEPDGFDHSAVVVKTRDGEIISGQNIGEFSWCWIGENDVDIVEFTMFE